MSTTRDEFTSLLRELFQFDSADLDFGIYRILNEKREAIERFIKEDLVDEIDNQLEALQAQDAAQLEEEYQEVRRRVVENFSEDVLGPDGELLDYHETNLGEEYQEAYAAYKEIQEAAKGSELTERRIYDDLYRFFNRYYDRGDFVTKRRFSSGTSKYYVPYDGEEVMLHWANRDQYYVKTSERFTDYHFTADDYHVHFKLETANTPTDNTKGDTRYFVPVEEDPVQIDEESITFRFEYRPITEEEEEHFLDIYNELPGKTYKTLSRRRLCKALEALLLDEVEDTQVQAALAREHKETEHSVLLTHLNRYSARNTADYFVHKDLGRFLRGQLDFFIKNEVLQLEDVLGDVSGHALQQARVHANVVQSIGERIIDFLAQIEDFQKRLFEKKKFVVQTDYCITVDQVPEELYPEILENEAQREEWRALYATDQWEQNLEWNGTFDEAFLRAHPHVMIDTAHFGQDFKDRLLASFDDLEAVTDGLLVHGENFQALNLLREKFREKVKCIYIDPPYNTGGDNFVYKDAYRHSTWLSMMADRVGKSKSMVRPDGVFAATIDDNEENRLSSLLSELFGEENHLANLAIQSNPRGRHLEAHIATSHEYALVYLNNNDDARIYKRPLTREQREEYNHSDDRGDYRLLGLRKRGAYSKREERPNLHFTIYYNPDEEVISLEGGEGFVEIIPKLSDGTDGVWRWSKGKIEAQKDELMCRVVRGREEWDVFQKDYLDEEDAGRKFKTLWSDKEVNYENGKRELRRLFNDAVYDTVKPLGLIKRICSLGSSGGHLVLDYFAGSGTTGHAVMDMNEDEEEARRYILVEMSKYFDTVLKPRLKKVAFTSNWKDGVPQDRQGQTHCFKYHRLESYEDTLNNLRIQKPEGPQLELLYEEMDDYVLHYMLEHETEGSPSLLAQDAFEHPFDYTLQIQRNGASPEPVAVDLVETFHYLIGMQVERYQTPQHQGRRYVVTRGTVETATGIEQTVCIWRDLKEPDDLDLEAEASWVEDEVLTEEPADRIYVNGSSQIRGAEPLEIPFRTLMG